MGLLVRKLLVVAQTSKGRDKGGLTTRNRLSQGIDYRSGTTGVQLEEAEAVSKIERILKRQRHQNLMKHNV